MKALILCMIMATSVFANTNLKKIQTFIVDNDNPVVIFDLDDTLFYSSSRSFLIFKELGNSKDFQEKYPIQVEKLLKIRESQIEYNIEETLINAGIKHRDFINKALEFWKMRFFTNEYVKEDTPVEGARDYVEKLRNLGATIVYLTGRDHSMRAGTVESLKNSNFPYDTKTSILITKEKFEIPDIEYKKAAFQKIEKLGNVVAFFENEPKNLNAMIEKFPNAVPVFLDIKHSPAPVLPNKKAIKIKNYLFNPLVGAWKLIGSENEIPNVGNDIPFCTGFNGYFLFTADGYASVAINCGDKEDPSVSEPADQFGRKFFYTGTYKVQDRNLFVAIENSSEEGLIGETSIRVMTLEDNFLILAGFNGSKFKAIWEKVHEH